MWTADVPFLASAVGRQHERSLAGADQHPYSTHRGTPSSGSLRDSQGVGSQRSQRVRDFRVAARRVSRGFVSGADRQQLDTLDKPESAIYKVPIRLHNARFLRRRFRAIAMPNTTENDG